MKNIFNITQHDTEFIIRFKREANIMLASLENNKDSYEYYKEHLKNVYNVIKSIDKNNPKNESDIDFIINIIDKIWNNGILSPLTLKDDEFSKEADNFGNYRNIRYNYIYQDDTIDKNIYNENAFNCYIKAIYNHKENKEIKSNNLLLKGNHRIYISKGGIITGEYIEKCIIPKYIVDKHCFTIQSIVNVPVSNIIDDNKNILVVDHREPKLKVLKEFYKVPTIKSFEIANKHYNIRKYIKLNKQ